MKAPRKKHWSDTVQRGLAHGYRSGLEAANAKLIEAAGQPVVYEKLKVKYVVPASVHTYSPDFRLANGIIVETKGIFDAKDRAKHLFIKLQYPDLDVRFVFSSRRTPINPGAAMTVSEWAERHGYLWAEKTIPAAWLTEPGPTKPPEDVLKAGPVVMREHLERKPP